MWIGPLTKKQIYDKKRNKKNKELKKKWDKKNRPWKYKDMMLELEKSDPILWKQYLLKRRVLNKKWKSTPAAMEKNKIYSKNYRERCKAKGKVLRSAYNPLRAKAYREKNKLNKTNKWFSDNLRKIIHNVFRRRSSMQYKNFKSNELLGSDFETVRKHIESLFKLGMSWDNYGKWHLDHVMPCASFNLKCPIQQLACCHYKNLQPLWAFDNLSKGAKII